MNKKQRFRGLFVFVSAFFVMLTAVLSTNINNNIMKAESTIDDSPSGEKIVKIEGGDQAGSYACIDENKVCAESVSLGALTENGQLYSWTSRNLKPKKVVNALDATDGGSYLSNIIDFEVNDFGSYLALSKDGDLYGWGRNITHELGNVSGEIPSKIPLGFKVKAIEMSGAGICNYGVKAGYFSFILSENGDVYMAGMNEGWAMPGLPSSVTSFTKVPGLSGIKDMVIGSYKRSFLTESGEIYTVGQYPGDGINQVVPGRGLVQAKFKNGSKVTGVKDIESFGTADIVFKYTDGNLYHNFDNTKKSYYFEPLLENGGLSAAALNVIKSSKRITVSDNGFVYVLTENNDLYCLSDDWGNTFLFTPKLTLIEKDANTDYIDFYNSIESNPDLSISMYLTSEGTVYYNGTKLKFGDIIVNGKKLDTSEYKSKEKFNDSVNLNVSNSEGALLSDVKYKMTDHVIPTNSITTETSAEATYPFTIEEDKHIYQTYDFYLTGQESETKTSFTVDLYKKALSLTDVEDSRKYQTGKTITLSDNGFTGNTVSATLSKDGGAATPYTSGTAINEAGNYVINATDLYGNNVSYSFSIVDVPVPEDVTFTKTATGELTYGNAITKTDGIVGSLSLEYAEGVTPSTIKTLTLGTGGNESNFEVVNTNHLKVKGSDLSAQEYKLNVSGTDQNDMEFTGVVKITIAKGTQTIDFDSASKAFGTSGKKMGDVFTLGTTNVLGGATVTYSADSCATISSNQATITCVPASGKITFTASAAATTNYDTKSVTLDIPVSKLDVTVKTQLLESGTYKDTTKIKVGDSLPNNKVTSVTPSDFDPTKLGTPTFTYKKAGVVVADPQKTAGTYDVDVSFSSSDGYNITITKGTLVVEDIVLDDDTKDDYYTLTSGGKTYTPDTWTKDPIIITPKHAYFNKMSVDNGSVTTTAYTYQSEGSNDVTLSFANVDDINITTTVKLKYDKTAPTMNDFTYEKPKSKLRAAFDHFFGEQKTVVFDASDTDSGVKTYDYEIYELDDSGNKITSSKKAGQGTSYTLSINKAYEINAKASDNAGNVSTVKTERVTLSDNIGKLDITAKSDGKVYDGTKWTSKAIDLTLKGTNVSGVSKYQYSEDGIVFNDITGNTISLPSPLANVDNKTYTFRAINNDGSQNDETFSMKVDIEKPVISVKGKSNGTDYDGSEVSSDVEIIPSQTKANISGITYYYTKDASAKDSDPLTDSKWTKQSGTILESTNGTHTYYVKGVSGAGLVSDVQSITIKLLKRNYTTVIVAVTTEGKAYTPDTWAKGDVTFKLSGGIADTTMITGYEYAVTTGAKPTASTTWIAVTGSTLTLKENIKGQTYYFRVLPVDNLGSISKGTIVKLDVEKPSTPVITMKTLNADPIAKFINAISFGNWMKESVEVTITSTDTISGIDYYKYSETINGVKTDKVSKTGVITYDKDTKLTISASAVDKAGNISDVSESKEVMIDKEPPEIIGVKDQGEYKHYYLPRFIHVEDKLSGVKEASIQKGKETATPFTDEISVKEIGTYTIKASDNAENETTLIFKIIPLPSLDEIDGSDESKDIIDQVQKELDEIKDKIDETEKKDYEDWIKDATDKWESLRKKVVEDDGKTSKVEGVGDTNFDPKTELIVDPIEEDTLPVLPRRAMYSYDVYLKKGTTVVQPNGEIKVYLPYPDDAKPIIYEIDKDGNVREIAAVKEGEYVVFTTNTLMKYAISNTEQEVVDPDDKPVNPDVPNKPDDPKDPETPDKDVNHDSDGDGKADVNVDVDCDGKADINIDTNDDGLPDINIDTTGDGKPNYNVDLDGDNKPDLNIGPVKWKTDKCVSGGCVLYCTSTYYKPYLNIDTDGDNRPDVNVDINKDMDPELNVDIDGDFIPDIDIDSDGDGKADINVDLDGDGWPDKNLALILKWKPNKDVDQPIKYDTMSGIVIDEKLTPETWHPSQDENSGGNQGGSNGSENNSTSTKDNVENKAFGGASTGDTTKLVSLWMMLIFSIGTTYISYRLKKDFKK